MERDLWRALGGVAFVFGFVITLSACQGKSGGDDSSSVAGPPIHSIDVSWNANHDKDVNAAGGGYRVYYATSPGVSTVSAASVDVPYVSGATAPTSVNIPSLSAGTYYLRIVAYSAYNPLNVAGGNVGADSAEISVTIP